MEYITNHFYGIFKRAGSDVASSDLYGLGIRLGLYLQALSFILNATFYSPNQRASQVLPASIMVFSLLCSQAILHNERSIAPAESIIITVQALNVLLPGALVVALSPMGDDGVALLLCSVSIVFVGVNSLWLWGIGYHTLPRIDTRNLTLDILYRPTPIDGSIRGVALAAVIISLILLLAFFVIPNGWRWQYIAVQVLIGEPPKDSPQVDVAVSWLKTRGWFKEKLLTDLRLRMLIAFMTCAIFPILVTFIERMIQVNNLVPNSRLTDPGQIIPLITGCVGVVDSVGFITRTYIVAWWLERQEKKHGRPRRSSIGSYFGLHRYIQPDGVNIGRFPTEFMLNPFASGSGDPLAPQAISGH